MRTAIVAGFGSVGRRHARVLSGRVDRLGVVETDAKRRQEFEREYPSGVAARSLEELDDLGWPWPSTLAVIATWGPSHAQFFFDLAQRGVGHVVCEKPLAHSVHLGRTMVALARRQGISLAVNHIGRYIGRAQGLAQLAGAYGLGPAQTIVAHGGASCLVTNGIHFIDLICELFGAEPERVTSTARGEPINPRSSSLLFYEGSAAWTFPGRREAVLSFSNHSSVFPEIQICFSRSLMRVDTFSNRAAIFARDPEEVKRFPAVTRTGPANRPVFAGPIPGLAESVDAAFERLYDDVLSGDATICPPEAGLTALSACIGALTSGITGAAVRLPIDPESPAGRRPWPIS